MKRPLCLAFAFCIYTFAFYKFITACQLHLIASHMKCRFCRVTINVGFALLSIKDVVCRRTCLVCYMGHSSSNLVSGNPSFGRSDSIDFPISSYDNLLIVPLEAIISRIPKYQQNDYSPSSSAVHLRRTCLPLPIQSRAPTSTDSSPSRRAHTSLCSF